MIGRKKETRILNESLMDDRSHFIAVYGRRRIGKTFLIREVFNNRFAFAHAGVFDGTFKEELFAFDASLKEAGEPVGKQTKNWMEAFEKLKDLIRKSTEKKKIIFFDELSWMDTKNSDLIKALENFWNGWASARNDIVLIVCASATSWMLSKVIHSKGGLYNRLTDQIHLKAFSLAECEDYVKEKGLSLNRNQILEYYMIFGGVPYYWTFTAKGQSLPQIIDSALFFEDAPLKDEFEYLFSSIFNNPTVHIRIIETLAKKKVGMTREEIIENSGIINSGDLSAKLDELEKCGFIRKYNAYGMKSKNAVYQLIDNFVLFYYSFMEGRKLSEHFWMENHNTPAINTWRGLSFERICLLHISQIKQKLGIAGVSTEANSWYCKPDQEKGLFGSQIDLLIIRKDQVINLCEIKYSGFEYAPNKEDDENFRRHIHDLVTATKTKYAIYPTLITTYGMVENSYSGAVQAVITMDDLFLS